ncbi:hypothetical protein LSCM1_07402 [Leishmania martiniquensis]|uniref:Uncharacterized protein n=1 Tax=Leishmania martiniquensis TaxID=1580590 RepID=A0A836H9S2_9TRYP|nr:hypothetical protein LSCM1_07402 [Leishmania martiniquensis]
MRTGNPEQANRSCSDASLVATGELSGWASVAEALLVECARAALVDVAEPSARARLVAKYVDSLAVIVQAQVTDVVTLQRRTSTAEEKRSTALVHQLHAAVSECERVNTSLLSERACRATSEEESRRLMNELLITQEERDALRAERTAVWRAVQEAHAVTGITCASNATIEEHIRALCGWVRKAEVELANAAMLIGPTNLLPVEVAPYQSARPLYRRILPTTSMSPATASLLRVKEQVQLMREPSVEQLQLAMGMHRSRSDEAAAPLTPSTRKRVTTAMPARTSLLVNPLLSRPSFCTPHRSTNDSAAQQEDVVASPPWRTHMEKLQEELKGLRRDLGTANSSP